MREGEGGWLIPVWLGTQMLDCTGTSPLGIIGYFHVLLHCCDVPALICRVLLCCHGYRVEGRVKLV